MKQKKKQRTVMMIFGKNNSMKKVLILSLFCFMAMQTFGQTKDANTVFAQAEEQLSAKNYNDALSKLALYENLSNASKEKAQVLKIQIYRELALKDSSQMNNYNNAVEVLKNMFAEGEKVNAEDLYRILKEQQEFSKDASSQDKENLNATSSEISIDGIKIGMNVEEIPSQIAANFDWSQGIKGQANSQMNYVPLMFMPKQMGTGGVFNFKMSGIQNITADDRTRRVIQVMKAIESDKYKKKEKTGLSKYNALVAELKTKYGESNVTVNPPQVITNKIMNREMTTETYSTIIRSKSVTYSLTYVIINDDTYSIMENMSISDYIKN
jgi:hypothetical protein